jgi:RsiW-degrading membrane proteinase PrsW (M82 family)
VARATGTSVRGRDRRESLEVFLGGLLLWVVSVAVTFWTGNANLVPTVILLGSFLVPVTFVVFAFERHADQVLTTQRILIAFLYGGVLGVLGASILEAEFLKQPSGLAYVGVGLIEEAVKLAALWVVALRLPRYTMRDGIVLGATVGLGFAALESAGYAFTALLTMQGLSLQKLVETQVLRGVLTPVGHGLWTAILGGVLFRAAARTGRLRLSGGGGRLVCGGGAAACAVGRLPGHRGLVDPAADGHPRPMVADPDGPGTGADPGPGARVHRHQLGAAAG